MHGKWVKSEVEVAKFRIFRFRVLDVLMCTIARGVAIVTGQSWEGSFWGSRIWFQLVAMGTKLHVQGITGIEEVFQAQSFVRPRVFSGPKFFRSEYLSGPDIFQSRRVHRPGDLLGQKFVRPGYL